MEKYIKEKARVQITRKQLRSKKIKDSFACAKLKTQERKRQFRNDKRKIETKGPKK